MWRRMGLNMTAWLKPGILQPLPGSHYLEILCSVLFLCGMVWIAFSVALKLGGGLPGFVGDLGVKVSRVRRAAHEIERKSFHLTGLGVPLAYAIALDWLGIPQEQFVRFAWTVTAMCWCCDLSRVYIPLVRDNNPLSSLLREEEKTSLTGSCYFSLGVTTSIALFQPSVAIAAITFLIFGDMMAALIGVSFGGETVSLKLGREGKKSVEGSVAMFVACFLVGFVVFKGAPLAEYVAAIGALVATLVELFEPFGLNDNLTIPICGSLALTWALHRVQDACIVESGGSLA